MLVNMRQLILLVLASIRCRFGFALVRSAIASLHWHYEGRVREVEYAISLAFISAASYGQEVRTRQQHRFCKRLGLMRNEKRNERPLFGHGTGGGHMGAVYGRRHCHGSLVETPLHPGPPLPS